MEWKCVHCGQEVISKCVELEKIFECDISISGVFINSMASVDVASNSVSLNIKHHVNTPEERFSVVKLVLENLLRNDSKLKSLLCKKHQYIIKGEKNICQLGHIHK